MSRKLHLVKPTTKYESSFAEMVNGYRQAGEQRYSNFSTSGRPDPQRYIENSNDLETANEEPASTYWLTDGSSILGVVRIRTHLSEVTSLVGGHIGFDVPHAHRGNGYGTILLGLALEEAPKLGLTRALLTCTKGNIASEKIILKNGGLFEKEVYWEKQDVIKKRFWIELTQ